MENSEKEFKKELGLLDGTMLVVGSMIGSGIFIVSADIVRQVGSAGWLIAIWLLTSFITIVAAVSYGELSAMFPKAGGQYVYLKEAYNKLIAFLYGWSRGVKDSKLLQTVLTIIKILSLIGLIVFGFIYGAKAEIWNANWENAFALQSFDKDTGVWSAIAGTTIISAVSAAMVGSVFSSDAWNGVTFIAGEIKNPQRNVGLSLFLGTFIVSLIYVLANVMYLAVVPLQDIATAPSDRVAVVAAHNIFGAIGTTLIAIMIMISTFACNNGLIMAGARVYYTMAKDGLFFKKAANLNEASVPSWALWAQCIWASALCLTGKYGDLLDFVVIIVLIFYILTIYGIFILRKKRPDAERPYKAFGYPFLPMLYILIALALSISLLLTKFTTCGWGVLIMLTGIPIYYMTQKK